ncbi:hypothetical protein H4R19_002307 [Coemansia spiralis]|nr:hypothetical protein H4R19_002307 [Coemansia spiralis]
MDEKQLAIDSPHSGSDMLSHSTILSKSAEDDEPPPDSARGWVVVLGSFLVLMIVVGTLNSFGVYLQEYKLSVFPTTSSSTLTWIGCMQFTTMCVFSIGAGVLVERTDPRAVIVLGSVVCGGGLLIASACRTPLALLFTQGLLFGIGASCLMVPAVSLPSQWIDRHRALAAGISLAGGSIGGVWMSLASKAMIGHLGWQWSLRITGMVTLAAGCASSPLMTRRIDVPKRDRVVDISAMRNTRFLLLFAACLFNTGGYFLPYYFQPPYAVVALGMSSRWGANISSILNAGSIAGRIIIGLSADFIGPLNSMLLSTAVSAIAILAMWLPCNSIGLLVASALLYGFVSGSVASLVPVVTASLFGIKRLPSILGLLFVSYAVGSLVSSPVGGKLLDDYGHGTDFKWLIVYNGLYFVVGTLLLFALRMSLCANLLHKL